MGTTSDPTPARDAASQAEMTPSKALQLLREGNARFVANRPAARDLLRQVEATASGQFPFAIVLSCIDSRASVELIFDQGVGDVFSARVAGNVCNDDMLGSMEFACQLAGARLIVVMGHTRCGAVQGACMGAELGHLSGLLAKLRPALDDVIASGTPARDDPDFVQAVARANVRLTMEQIRARSDVLAKLLEQGQIDMVGAMYDVASGAVEFDVD